MARRGDGLVLRGKTWWLDFRHNGIRHRVRIAKNINKTVAGEIAAVKRAAILKAEVGIDRKRKDISYEAARDEFLKWARANKKPRTVAFYESCFTRLNESFKGRMLSQIHPFLVEKHKQTRVAAGHRVAVNRELAALSSMFNRCKEWKKFEGENPAQEVERIDEPLTRLQFLTEDEEARLLAALSEPQRTIVMLGLYMGLRIGAEALTLRKENVDLENRLLTIEAAYSKNGKTQTLPIHSCLIEPLRARMQLSNGDWLFPGPKGKPMHDIRTSFENACAAAQIPGNVTPHILRHTFASRLAMKGVNNLTLQLLGRWEEPKMLQRYAHLSSEHLAEALEQIQPMGNLVMDFTQSKKKAIREVS
jgi:integrase